MLVLRSDTMQQLQGLVAKRQTELREREAEVLKLEDAVTAMVNKGKEWDAGERPARIQKSSKQINQVTMHAAARTVTILSQVALAGRSTLCTRVYRLVLYASLFQDVFFCVVSYSIVLYRLVWVFSISSLSRQIWGRRIGIERWWMTAGAQELEAGQAILRRKQKARRDSDLVEAAFRAAQQEMKAKESVVANKKKLLEAFQTSVKQLRKRFKTIRCRSHAHPMVVSARTWGAGVAHHVDVYDVPPSSRCVGRVRSAGGARLYSLLFTRSARLCSRASTRSSLLVGGVTHLAEGDA